MATAMSGRDTGSPPRVGRRPAERPDHRERAPVPVDGPFDATTLADLRAVLVAVEDAYEHVAWAADMGHIGYAPYHLLGSAIPVLRRLIGPP